MKRLLICTAIVALSASAALAREWTSADGKSSTTADYYAKRDSSVILRTSAGKLIEVPLDKLSQRDQEYVAGQPASVALSGPVRERAPVQEQVTAAKDRFTEAIKRNPNDPSAYFTRGMALVKQGKYSDALSDFDEAIARDKSFAAAYDGRGMALSKMGKPFEAHAEFDRAIEVDPELASAYRHRGDNIDALWKTPQGKDLLKQRAEKYREKYERARSSNLSKTPWQPLNTTSGNMVQTALNQMQQVDYLRAKEIEDAYGGGVGGSGGYGVGVGGGGISIGNGGVRIVNGGLTVVNPGTKVVGNPALSVYPEEVVVGQTVTLVANPSELASAMPAKLDSRGRPVRVKGTNGGVQREPVYGVDFYRDVDGNGLLDPAEDEYLASDNNKKDGFSVEVSTANFPPGNQAYFAVGRGQQPAGVPSTYGQAAEAIRQAAATEREIAEQSKAASASGYTTEQAQQLRSDQKKIGENAQKMAAAFQGSTPEAAQLLASALKPMRAVDTRLDAGEKRPGVGSIAEATAKQAEMAADYLDQAYAKLAERAQGEEEGKRSPSPAAPAGGAAVASGMVKPAKPGPGAVAGGPGQGGNGSGNNNDGGGYDGGRGGDYDDKDDRVVLVDDDDDVRVVRRGDDDRDVVVIDDEPDTVIDRALTYIDDDDYDRAVVEYDRYLDVYEDDDVRLHLADAYTRRGSYDYAVREYDQLVDLDRERLAAINVEQADLYYNRGCARLAAGRLDDAIADFTKSIDLGETRSLAYTNRGTAWARKGDYRKAKDDFTIALEKDPRDELARRNRALAYQRLDMMTEYQQDIKILRDGPAVGE